MTTKRRPVTSDGELVLGSFHSLLDAETILAKTNELFHNLVTQADLYGQLGAALPSQEESNAAFESAKLILLECELLADRMKGIQLVIEEMRELDALTR